MVCSQKSRVTTRRTNLAVVHPGIVSKTKEAILAGAHLAFPTTKCDTYDHSFRDFIDLADATEGHAP